MMKSALKRDVYVQVELSVDYWKYTMKSFLSVFWEVA